MLKLLPVIENHRLIPVTLLYGSDIMSATTTLDFQAVITQNEGNKKLLENTSIILEKEVMTCRGLRVKLASKFVKSPQY